MRNYVLLFVNGQPHLIGGGEAFLTLSDFLRLRLKLSGTKIVCSEGDCGSCSVLCGKLGNADKAKQVNYFAIDSCIRFVFQLDGCHVVTVEGLTGHDKRNGQINGETNCELTGVQQAMVDCHGSQCGFCTPGFVMAMTGILESNDCPTEDQWRHGLTGNLCRCTGYSPIIRAGLNSNRSNTSPINECFPAADMVEATAATRENEMRIQSEGDSQSTRIVYSPVTIRQATDFLAEHPEAKMVAGATDVGVQFNKSARLSISEKSLYILDLNRVESLTGISTDGETIKAGARATWMDIEHFTQQLVPEFHKIVSVFGSPQIRHVGTIGGNLINASPIADSLPYLLVSESKLELTSQAGMRSININEFYLGYKKFDLRPGELLTRIIIPLPPKNGHLRLYKVSRRRDLDISTFTAAIQVVLAGDVIENVAIVYGAVGPVVLRLRKTEEFLRGRKLSLETMQSAGDVAVEEISPISDVRGGKEYRFQLARNVLIKFFYETRAEGVVA